MGDPVKTSSDLKVGNVSLHGRGKPEKGTLCLYRHHLVFKYTPRELTGTSLRAPSIGNAADHSPRSSASLESAHHDYRDSPSRNAAQAKLPVKEIWIPYPMINYCIFSPSIEIDQRKARRAREEEEEKKSVEQGAFPPVYGTNSVERPSTDSVSSRPRHSFQRQVSEDVAPDDEGATLRVPTIRIRRRDFQMVAFHFLQERSYDKTSNDLAREVFYCLRSRCVVDKVQDMHAFHFKAPREELAAANVEYDARREFARMGIGGKAAEGPGSAWRITDINKGYEYSPTYPSVLCVPQTVSDNILKYGGSFRSKARIPALTYLHSNGGSISRSSQPLVGLKGKRSPQDERLVSAIFSSHTPFQQSPEDSPPHVAQGSGSDGARTNDDVPSLPMSQYDTALDVNSVEDEAAPSKKIYGSTRRNLIVDARPKINAMANLTGGGGFEDIANYPGPPGTTVERTFLGIANIHVMRKSLDKVIESFANSDYLDLKPNAELLRNSGWLTHIEGLLSNAEMVARRVGLGGSHVLVHCSDGWDRTSQVAALAEIMLDPYYRSLQGFITLVQKDFMSFGHKFNHRHGLQGSEKWFEIENERVIPSRPKDGENAESPANNFGAKAFSGAKNWFEKNRNNLFRSQNEGKQEYDGASSRPPSPPPNPVLHSPATTSTKKDREHKTDLSEIAPIFHQFLDAVYQLQYYHPNAFEFNERFLRRLFYQSYAGQYGEFLFNNEKDRSENSDKFASAWPHFLSRRHEFTNPDYVPKVDDPLLFAPRGPDLPVEIRWWSSLFGRKYDEMNTPQALRPPDPNATTTLASRPSNVSLGDGIESLDEGRRIPSIEVSPDQVVRVDHPGQLEAAMQEHNVQPEQLSTTEAVGELPRTTTTEESGEEAVDVSEPGESSSGPSVLEPMEAGDPLGVSSKVNELSSGRLDFAAFAKQSAYSDR